MQYQFDPDTVMGFMKQKKEFFVKYDQKNLTFESLGRVTKNPPFIHRGNDKDGRSVFYIKFDRLQPGKYESDEYVRYLMWMMEELQR